MKSLFLFLSACLAAQTPGSVNQITTSSIVGTAGSLICTLTNTTATTPSSIHAVCLVAGYQILKMDVVIAPGKAGVVGSYTHTTGDQVTWSVRQVDRTFNWDMTANNAHQKGTF